MTHDPYAPPESTLSKGPVAFRGSRSGAIVSTIVSTIAAIAVAWIVLDRTITFVADTLVAHDLYEVAGDSLVLSAMIHSGMAFAGYFAGGLVGSPRFQWVALFLAALTQLLHWSGRSLEVVAEQWWGALLVLIFTVFGAGLGGRIHRLVRARFFRRPMPAA